MRGAQGISVGKAGSASSLCLALTTMVGRSLSTPVSFFWYNYNIMPESKRRRRQRDQSDVDDSSSSSIEDSRYRHRRKEDRRRRHKRKSRRSKRYDDSSVSSASTTSSREERRRAKKKRRKEKKKRKQKKASHRKSQDHSDVSISAELGNSDAQKPVASNVHDDKKQPAMATSMKEAKQQPSSEPTAKSRNMAPMTYEQHQALQSQVREVYDPESGRMRLVRGTGEIIERIVSRADHHTINRQATMGDGAAFARQVASRAAREFPTKSGSKF